MTDLDRQRYARQLSLSEVGQAGQERLADSSVLVIGAGGLGSPVLHHLAAAGIGSIGIVEFDTVDISNLHRQTLFGVGDIGEPKVDAAARRLRAVNPGIRIVRHAVQFRTENSDSLLSIYDVVVDGSDTFTTRYAVNDAAVRAGIPLVYASVSQFSGQASVFNWKEGPCYRCLFPAPPPPGLIPSCEVGGVLGVVPAIMGVVQATETLKLVLGIGEPLTGRLLLFEALGMTFRELRVDRDLACPTCGDRPRAVPSDEVPEVTSADLKARLASDAPPVLLDVREAAERQAGHFGGHHIPLGMLDARTFELDDVRDQSVVVYCASGGRSAQAVRLLRKRGFKASSLRGGIQAWNLSRDKA